MFEEPEWAEEAPAVTDLRPVVSRPRLTAASQIKGSKRRKLLATLRALEAASLPQQPPSLPGSDSEEEEVVERKKKRPKKALFASDSTEVEEKRKTKRQKQGPPSSDSEEEEVERKKCHRGAPLGSDSAEGEKRKRKRWKQAPSNPAQHLDSVDQTGLKAWNSSATSDSTKPSPETPSTQPPRTLSRKQWRNRQKNKRRQKNKFRPPQPPEQAPAPAPATGPTAQTEVPPVPSPDSHGARAEALRARMAQRLDGARFRYLNEQLYSGPSSAAQRLFQEDPEAFLLYHRGFQSQVKKWPLQPVDRIARDLRQRGLLKVAEVSSRFEDVRNFLGAVTKLGFKVISKDLTNSHFFLFDFQKTGAPRVGPKAQLSGLKLQPCLYKRR
ncbi:ribosomal RNA-processing protein 8 isoform X2 [Vicugna pacos]|uniref:Ribosomal RNA-processing protein 8 n=1 Tax=Vicugna pacos TaxID=30538 RepID=A0ABM5DX75_VICPA